MNIRDELGVKQNKKLSKKAISKGMTFNFVANPTEITLEEIWLQNHP